MMVSITQNDHTDPFIRSGHKWTIYASAKELAADRGSQAETKKNKTSGKAIYIHVFKVKVTYKKWPTVVASLTL